jgi:hypothetical protein
VTRQPDLFDAISARDAALDRVADNAGGFMSDALAAIRHLPPGRMTGEDIRKALTDLDIAPHHHNAWGALIMAAVRGKLLTPTNDFTHMRGGRSHGRMTRIYEKA